MPKEKAPLSNTVKVMVAGSVVASSDVLYAGAAQGQPGVCQIDVKLPSSLADGDVPVSVQIGTLQAQSGTVLSVKQ